MSKIDMGSDPKKEEEFPRTRKDWYIENGTRSLKVGNVSINAMSPEARDCLDRVMEAWRLHWAELSPEFRIADPDAVYGFAYWLIRYSGLVIPNNENR